jgi:hypothetical protein
MCNCNQKRAMYSSGNNQSPKGSVKVMLTENTPLEINGNITGRLYVFTHINDTRWVDKRDAMEMKEINGLQIFL